MDHRLIIKRNFSDLESNIDSKNTVLWDRLVQTGIYDDDDANYIRDKYPARKKQNEEILKRIQRSSRECYFVFRDCLKHTKQHYVVDQWLPDPDTALHILIKKIRVHLAKLYLTRYKKMTLWRTSGEDPDPVDFDKVYTEMCWVKYNRAANEKESPAISHYTQILNTSSKLRVLVWGEAGTGKSTFCEKFCQDWSLVVMADTEEGTSWLTKHNLIDQFNRLTSEQKFVLNKLDILMHIILRKTRVNESIEDIMGAELDLGSFNVGLADCFDLILNKCTCTLLLDGIDEMRNEAVDQIVKLEKHLDVNFIVTCRPYVSQDLAFTADCEMRLKGFSTNQSKMYVKLYYAIKLETDPESEEVRKQTQMFWEEIESSEDLMEMITNPLMLQLLCFLKHVNPDKKLGRNRTEVFQDYTLYLLKQFDEKKGRKSLNLGSDYKQQLLDSGDLALFGLQQEHFQLVFSKAQVLEKAGESVFQIGFVTNVPGQKYVQFIHYSLMEYLAAYAVVNGPEEKGMQSLMNFISTSKRFMRSHIILSFIRTMSKTMGQKVQEKLQHFAQETSDEISPRLRTSFLIAMLKEDKSLKFNLPQIVDVDFHEFEVEKWMSWLQTIWKYLKYLKYVNIPLPGFIFSLFETTTLQRFFTMNSQGVKELRICLGETEKLEVLSLYQRHMAMNKVSVNFSDSPYEQQNDHLLNLIEGHSSLDELSLTNFLSEQDPRGVSAIMKLVNTISSFSLQRLHFGHCHIRSTDCSIILGEKWNALQELAFVYCGLEIDGNLCKLIHQMNKNVRIDLSGNTIRKTKRLPPNHLARLLQCFKDPQEIDISHCDLDIDKDVVVSVSRLPSHIDLNLSGNKVKKHTIAPAALARLLQCFKEPQKIDLSHCNIEVNKIVVDAIASLPSRIRLNLSGNKIKKYSIPPEHLARLLQSFREPQVIDLSYSDICINKSVVNAIVNLPTHVQLNLSGNTVEKYKITAKHLSRVMKCFEDPQPIDFSDCDISINKSFVAAVASIPKYISLNLSRNKIEKYAIPPEHLSRLLICFTEPQIIDLSNCNIEVDNQLAKVLHNLPTFVEVDLSNNVLSKIESCYFLAVLKCLPVQSNLSLAGWNITVDREIINVLKNSLLLQHLKYLDLSGNIIEDEYCVRQILTLPEKASLLNTLRLRKCGIIIDDFVAERANSISNQIKLDLSENKIVKMSPQVLSKLCECICSNEVNQERHVNMSCYELSRVMSLSSRTTVLDLSGKCLFCPYQIRENMPGITFKNFQSICSKLEIEMIPIRDMFSYSLCGAQGPVYIKEGPNYRTFQDKNKTVVQMKRQSETSIQSLKALSNLSFDCHLDLSESLQPWKYLSLRQMVYLFLFSHNITSLNVGYCGLVIDSSTADTLSNMYSLTYLDISGNKIIDEDIANEIIVITIIKMAHRCDVVMRKCGILISQNIRKHLFNLPCNSKLDMSGNTVNYEMFSTFLEFPILPNVKVEHCESIIDMESVEAISSLKEHIRINLSGNKILDPMQCVKFMEIQHVASLSLKGCGLKLDKRIAKAIQHMNKGANLDLSENRIQNNDIFKQIINNASKLESLACCSCKVKISRGIITAIGNLPHFFKLDISGNRMDNSKTCVLLLKNAKRLKYLGIRNCGISIGQDVAEAVLELPKWFILDLSDNRVIGSDIGDILLLWNATLLKLNNCNIRLDSLNYILKASQRKSLDLCGNYLTYKNVFQSLVEKSPILCCNHMQNCNILIDTSIAKLICLQTRLSTLNLSGNRTENKSCLILMNEAKHLTKLILQKCGIKVNEEIAAAVSVLPKGLSLNLSYNKIVDIKSGRHLMQNAHHLGSLELLGCFPHIEKDIVDEICMLPNSLSLDISHNEVVEKTDVITLLKASSNLASLKMCDCKIEIDVELVNVISELRKSDQLALSGNKIKDRDVFLVMMKQVPHIALNLEGCGVEIDSQIPELAKNCSNKIPLDLAGNVICHKNACELIMNAKNCSRLNLESTGICIDSVIADVVHFLPSQTELNLSKNTIDQHSDCVKLIENCKHLTKLYLSGCGLHIDNDIAGSILMLSQNMELDLSYNTIDQECACLCIENASHLKSLQLRKCGLEINAKVAQSIDKVFSKVVLDLSENTLGTMREALLSKAILTLRKPKQAIDLSHSSLTFTSEFVTAVSALPLETELNLSGNRFRDTDVVISLINNSHHLSLLEMRFCHIVIDKEVAEALSMLSNYTAFDASGNIINNPEVGELLMDIGYQLTDQHICSWPKERKLYTSEQYSDKRAIFQCTWNKQACNICYSSDAECRTLLLNGFAVEIKNDTIMKLQDAQLVQDSTGMPIIADLSRNKMTKLENITALLNISHVYDLLDLNHCDIHLDGNIVKTIKSFKKLPPDINLSGNKISSKQVYKELVSVTSTKITLNDCDVVIDEEVCNCLISTAKYRHEINISGLAFSNNYTIMQLLRCQIYLRTLAIVNCGIVVDTIIAEAVSNLPDHTNVDLSENKIDSKNSCLCLLFNARHLSSLKICKCRISIDAEVLDVVFRLSTSVALDLSGNTVSDPDHFSMLFTNRSTGCLKLNNCNIIVDEILSQALLPHSPYHNIDLSQNEIKSTRLFKQILNDLSYLKIICLSSCGVEIDASVSESVSHLQPGTELFLNKNKFLNVESCASLLNNSNHMSRLELSECNIEINYELAKVICEISGDVQLNLSKNRIPHKGICLYLIENWNDGKVLNLSDCGMEIDKEVLLELAARDIGNIAVNGNKLFNSDMLPEFMHNYPFGISFKSIHFSLGNPADI